jgi:predicted RNase H-like HicB family nuclease
MLKKLTLTAGALMMLALASGPVLADGHFGAIATSEKYYAISTDKDSQAEAEKDAEDTCNTKGETCSVAVWFTHCGATAESATHVSWGIGDTKEEAIAAAKSALDGHGDLTSDPIGECNS